MSVTAREDSHQVVLMTELAIRGHVDWTSSAILIRVPILGHLQAILGYLETILGCLGAILDDLEAILGTVYGDPMEAILGLLAATLATPGEL